jgi:hypothetical protein
MLDEIGAPEGAIAGLGIQSKPDVPQPATTSSQVATQQPESANPSTENNTTAITPVPEAVTPVPEAIRPVDKAVADAIAQIRAGGNRDQVLQNLTETDRIATIARLQATQPVPGSQEATTVAKQQAPTETGAEPVISSEDETLKKTFTAEGGIIASTEAVQNYIDILHQNGRIHGINLDEASIDAYITGLGIEPGTPQRALTAVEVEKLHTLLQQEIQQEIDSKKDIIKQLNLDPNGKDAQIIGQKIKQLAKEGIILDTLTHIYDGTTNENHPLHKTLSSAWSELETGELTDQSIESLFKMLEKELEAKEATPEQKQAAKKELNTKKETLKKAGKIGGFILLALIVLPLLTGMGGSGQG